MIKYDRLRKTMKEKNVSFYQLTKEGLGHATIDKLKKNKSVTTTTIDNLCRILDCNVEDIMEYIDEDEPRISLNK